MINKNVKQNPNSTTLMSALKGAYEFYYDDKVSDAMLYGLSGHAFITNIAVGLCPSGPYTWDMEKFGQLTQNALGLNMFDLPSGFIFQGSPADNDENKISATNDIKQILDDKNLALLISLEHQLIIGYDDTKFICTLPWDGKIDSEVKEISLDTLKGKKDVFGYHRISKTDKNPDMLANIKSTLLYAIDLFDNPIKAEEMVTGIAAYDYWASQITKETSISHGNWWNSMVWGECKKMASEFFGEIEQYYSDDDSILLIEQISYEYECCANILSIRISDKNLDYIEKINLIMQAKALESNICEKIKLLLKD